MEKLKIIVVAMFVCLLVFPDSGAGIGISISPRVALPSDDGDFGNFNTGIGGAIALNKSVKGKPGRVGLVILSFPSDDTRLTASGAKNKGATAYGVFGGYKYIFGVSGLKLYGKVDSAVYLINKTQKSPKALQEGSAEDLANWITDGKIKIKPKAIPGVGLQVGAIAAEVDYDISGDWVGVNLFFAFGGK